MHFINGDHFSVDIQLKYGRLGNCSEISFDLCGRFMISVSASKLFGVKDAFIESCWLAESRLHIKTLREPSNFGLRKKIDQSMPLQKCDL